MERRFWQGIYDAGTVPFDLGRATPALCDWLDGHPLDLRGLGSSLTPRLWYLTPTADGAILTAGS